MGIEGLVKYGNNFYTDTAYSKELMMRFFQNTFLNPGVTYTNRYSVKNATQALIYIYNSVPAERGKVAEPFLPKKVENNLDNIRIENVLHMSPEIYTEQAQNVSIDVVREQSRLNMIEIAQGYNKMGLGCLIHEGAGNTITRDEDWLEKVDIDKLKDAILSAKTQLYLKGITPTTVLCSPAFYQKIVHYGSKEFTPILNDKIAYTGEMAHWMGLDYINMNLMQESLGLEKGQFNYYSATDGEEVKLKEGDINGVDFIMYNYNAFSIINNFSATRIVENPLATSIFVQNKIIFGMKVTCPDAVIIARHTIDLIDFSINRPKLAKNKQN